MDNKEKKLKQIELAKLFYEMGMEKDVVIKISGIDPTEYLTKINNAYIILLAFKNKKLLIKNHEIEGIDDMVATRRMVRCFIPSREI